MHLACLTAAAVVSLSGAAAQAFPTVSPSSITNGPEITLVSGGCGPFAHRGFYGHCRPGGGGYAVPYYGPRHFYVGPRYFVHRPFYGYHRYYY